MYISYTATREIDAGDAEIELPVDQDLESWDRDRKVDGKTETSLSGKQETTLNRIEVFYSVKTVVHSSPALAKWREFSASVAAGEQFSFDAFGTEASPDDVLTVSMVKDSFKETREGPAGLFSYAFRLRVAM